MMNEKKAIRQQIKTLRNMEKQLRKTIKQIQSFDAEELKESLISQTESRADCLYEFAMALEKSSTEEALSLLIPVQLMWAGIDFYDAAVGALIGWHEGYQKVRKS